MGTEIKAWQIIDGGLVRVDTTLRDEGRTEPYDLEPWIASDPAIIGSDIVVIGRQVMTRSGPIDILAVDRSGNTVVVEIKRDELPRDSLCQAIDYASNVAGWNAERLGEICSAYTGKTLEEVFNDSFPDIDLESVSLNSSQRILLAGFAIESALERMIEWLSDNYSVSINAVVLSYVKTHRGEELLARTSVISEEMEMERQRKQRKFEIPMSDEPGRYDVPALKQLLSDYLSRDRVTNKRIRDILLPVALRNTVVTRAELKRAFVECDSGYDESNVGYYVAVISSQLGIKKNDFLRQVVAYDYPRHPWEKDNFSVREEYRDLVEEILDELNGS